MDLFVLCFFLAMLAFLVKDDAPRRVLVAVAVVLALTMAYFLVFFQLPPGVYP